MGKKSYTKNSAMRLALIWGMWLVTLIFSGLTYKIIIGVNVDYSGMALLVGGLSTFIGALVTGKYFQKKEEIKQSEYIEDNNKEERMIL